MEALVRYPDEAKADRGEKELERLQKRAGRLRLALTVVLSVNVVLVCGAVTMCILLMHDTAR